VAQRSLYSALAQPVYTLLRRLVLRPAVAEELLQEVFLEVLRNLGRVPGCRLLLRAGCAASPSARR